MNTACRLKAGEKQDDPKSIQSSYSRVPRLVGKLSLVGGGWTELFLDMSIRHMAEVWADPYFGQIDKAKLLVALALADSARAEDGKAWPSIESIARKARTSIRGAQDAIRSLEKDGIISVTPFGGMNGTNAYFLCKYVSLHPPAMVAPPRNEAAAKAPVKPPVKAAADCTQSVRNHQEPSLSKRNRNGAIVPIPSQLTGEDFEKAWAEWYEYRRQSKFKPYLELGAQKQLGQLVEMGKGRAIAAINFSIAQGWQGIFEQKMQRGTAPPVRVAPVAAKDPAGWPDFLKSRELPYSAYCDSPPHFKEAFASWVKEKA